MMNSILTWQKASMTWLWRPWRSWQPQVGEYKETSKNRSLNAVEVAIERNLKANDPLKNVDLFSDAQLENFHRKVMNSIPSK